MLTRRVRKNTIPVVVLAGFLGSGKTTMLNYVLRMSYGAKVAVIVNDFGAVNIDSLLIAAQTDQKMELTNGCICCQVGDGELEEALEAATAADPDVIIIEASGLAQPDDLARLIILSPNKKIAYGGLVYVVDAVNYQETIGKHAQLTEHIRSADLIVLTKCEEVDSSEVDRLVAEILDVTAAPVIPVKNGRVSPNLLFDIPKRPLSQPLLLQQTDQSEHLHSLYRSIVFETNSPIDFNKLKAFMNQPPVGIYRIKGIVYFGLAGYEQKYVLQSVGRKWDMYAEPWEEEAALETRLVLIGTDFDEQEALSRLQSAIGESDSMLDIQRYLLRLNE